jgi:hypothetical protein
MRQHVTGGVALWALAACSTAGIPAAPGAAAGAPPGVAPAPAGEAGVELVEIRRTERSPTAGTVVVRVANTAPVPALVGVELRAEPGMWLAPARQELHLFYLPPRGARTFELPYAFAVVSPEAVLRVRVGAAEEQPDRSVAVPEPVAVRRFDAGATTAAARFLERFDRRATPELELFAVRGMFTAAELDGLVTARTRAIGELGRILGVEPPPGIRIVFYPDGRSKTADTRHEGAGLARGTTLVEVSNDAVRPDPFHELAHLVSGQLGWAPAWLNEGFAVFASEYLGADALALQGAPGKTVDQAACGFLRSGELLPVAELLRLDDIGPAETRPRITYAQAGSFTRFLALEHGWEALRQAYRTLTPVAPEDENEAAFAAAFGVGSDEAGRRWLARLAGACEG